MLEQSNFAFVGQPPPGWEMLGNVNPTIELSPVLCNHSIELNSSQQRKRTLQSPQVLLQ